jgi:hypothetical protein
MKTNNLHRIQTLEKEMRQHISKFLLPRSLANSEDIEYLKWLLNEKNFHLTLCQPIIYSAVYTQDRLTLCDQTDYMYLLNVTNLNVKLVEKSSSTSSSPDDHDSLNTTSNTSSSSEDDDLEEEELNACSYEKDKKFYVKFVNEKSKSLLDQDINAIDEFCGSLLISYKKIKQILAKEKSLIEKCRLNKIKSEIETVTNGGGLKDKNKFLIAEDMLTSGEEFIQRQKRQLELYRLRVMSTANFRGAKCLLNIKNKQILNRKTNGTSNLLRLASVPIANQSKNTDNATTTVTNVNGPLGITVSIVNTNGVGGGVGSNCSSLSSSISPSASSTTSSTNSIKGSTTRLKPRKIQKFSSYNSNGTTATHISDEITNSQSSSSSSASTSAQNYFISYSDLNERLFSCLLSNFSCKLVDNFLKTGSILKAKDLNEGSLKTSNGDSGVVSDNFMLKTGFIRKQKWDKSFSFINIINEPTSINNHNLQLDQQISKLNFSSYTIFQTVA